MQTKRLLTALSILLCIGTIGAGVALFQNRHYYLITAVLLLLACLPFGLNLRKIRTRELVVVATMTAIAVASRAAFYMIPTVKPLCAIAMITGIAFGGQVGFLTGAFAMFLSNFLFGQGAWTPFQVFGMGLTVFLASVILRRGKLSQNRFVTAIVGGVLCFAVYGVIVDTCSVLMMTTELSWKSALSIFASGVPFNLSHGITTAVVLFLLGKPLSEKLQRMQTKYGLFA